MARVAEITELSTKGTLDSARDRKRTEARSILCFWATDQLGITQQNYHELLPHTAPISHAVRRGRALVEANSHSIFDD